MKMEGFGAHLSDYHFLAPLLILLLRQGFMSKSSNPTFGYLIG